MKTKCLTVCFVLFFFSNLFAQPQAKISCAYDEHDFGLIEETDGKVQHRFVFVNQGNAPLIVNDVKACCGIDVIDWSEKPILPGKEGFVIGVFNPDGRPGKFEKTITIVSNAANESAKTFWLRGEVNPTLTKRPNQ